MMAGGTAQVIGVADAFCHLGVISLSQSDTGSRRQSPDDGSSHPRAQAQEARGFVCFQHGETVGAGLLSFSFVALAHI